MGKLYAIDNALLVEKPEIRIGDKVYVVDDRMKTFEKLNKALQEKDETSEFEKIITYAIGEKAYKDIDSMDLSFAVTQKITIIIMAAMQGISEVEAERRFQNATK